jgi:hypothetical protein
MAAVRVYFGCSIAVVVLLPWSDASLWLECCADLNLIVLDFCDFVAGVVWDCSLFLDFCSSSCLGRACRIAYGAENRDNETIRFHPKLKPSSNWWAGGICLIHSLVCFLDSAALLLS